MAGLNNTPNTVSRPSEKLGKLMADTVLRLEKMGIGVETASDLSGVSGTVSGAKPGKTVVLCADIYPPLACGEEGGACPCDNPSGHLGSAEMLFEAARAIADLKESLAGEVRFLFRFAGTSPAESSDCGACKIVEGADVVFGIGLTDDLPVSEVSVASGSQLATCTDFEIVVDGRAAHCSAPHLSLDVITAASSVILNLQTFASRNNDPLDPFVFTIGTVRSGTQYNIISDKTTMTGTMRFTPSAEKDADWAEENVRRIAEKSAEALGCKATVTFDRALPITDGSEKAGETAEAAVFDLFGERALSEVQPLMASRDFYFLLEKAPGAYAFVGTAFEDGAGPDADARANGAELYTRFALDFLSGGDE